MTCDIFPFIPFKIKAKHKEPQLVFFWLDKRTHEKLINENYSSSLSELACNSLAGFWLYISQTSTNKWIKYYKKKLSNSSATNGIKLNWTLCTFFVMYSLWWAPPKESFHIVRARVANKLLQISDLKKRELSQELLVSFFA